MCNICSIYVFVQDTVQNVNVNGGHRTQDKQLSDPLRKLPHTLAQQSKSLGQYAVLPCVFNPGLRKLWCCAPPPASISFERVIQKWPKINIYIFSTAMCFRTLHNILAIHLGIILSNNITIKKGQRYGHMAWSRLQKESVYSGNWVEERLAYSLQMAVCSYQCWL